MHEERDGSEVMLPRVREVTDTQTFWIGNANKGPGGLHMYIGDKMNIMIAKSEGTGVQL